MPLVPTVTLFTQDGCHDSARVRMCLILSGVPFVEHNVSTDPDAVPLMLGTGIFATPLVVAGEQAMLVTDRRDLADRVGFPCRCPDGGNG